MEVNNNNLLHRLDRVIVPLNRTYQCSHICLYGKALAWSIVVPFYGYHQRGKVMHARYPGPVGGDSLEIQSFYGTRVPVWDSCPRLGQKLGATTVACVG